MLSEFLWYFNFRREVSQLNSNFKLLELKLLFDELATIANFCVLATINKMSFSKKLKKIIKKVFN